MQLQQYAAELQFFGRPALTRGQEYVRSHRRDDEGFEADRPRRDRDQSQVDERTSNTDDDTLSVEDDVLSVEDDELTPE